MIIENSSHCVTGIAQKYVESDIRLRLAMRKIRPLMVLEIWPLRFRKGELKVTFTRPLQLKGHLYKR